MKNTKILTVLGVLLAMGLTGCGKTNPSGGSASQGGDSTSKHTHEWGQWSEVTPATCDEAGEEKRTCSSCDEVETRPIAALGHDFAASEEPYFQAGVSYLECSRCDKGALEWAAKDYDPESEDIEKTAADGSIRLVNGQYWKKSGNDGQVDPTVNGSHLIYYIQTNAKADNVGLAFKIKQKSDWDGPLFDAQSGDQIKGQIRTQKEDGTYEYTAATKRYGLKINDEDVALGEDKSGTVNRGTEGWYDWPVKFNLKAGVNKIEIICLGGYRAYLFNFRFTGVAAYAHEHAYDAKVADNAAGDGYIATQTVVCTYNCGATALRWAATDYDKTDSNDVVDIAQGKSWTDNGGYTAPEAGVAMNNPENKDGQTASKGTHYVYKINSAAKYENVGLEVKLTARIKSGNYPIFDAVSSDTGPGYVQKEDGTFAKATKRYGLKVNNAEVALGDDLYGAVTPKTTKWFNANVSFTLNQGVNVIDFYCLGGYKATAIYGFQITGLPKAQNGTFTLSETWQHDETGHWKTAEGQDGVKFMFQEHAWGDDPDHKDVAGTCDAAGVDYKKCRICGETAHEDIPAGHDWVAGTPANNSDGFAVTPLECSRCHKVGAQMAVASFTGNTKTDATYKHDNNTTVTYKIVVSKAGNYRLEIGAFIGSNRGKDLSTTPYTVKVGTGDSAVDVAVSTGTYEELGIGTSSAKQFVLCPTIALEQGENVIAITQGGNGYRLTFGGNVEVFEK